MNAVLLLLNDCMHSFLPPPPFRPAQYPYQALALVASKLVNNGLMSVSMFSYAGLPAGYATPQGAPIMHGTYSQEGCLKAYSVQIGYKL